LIAIFKIIIELHLYKCNCLKTTNIQHSHSLNKTMIPQSALPLLACV